MKLCVKAIKALICRYMRLINIDHLQKKLTALYIYQPTQERARLKLAKAWRKITTAPGLSDKDAVPCPSGRGTLAAGGSQLQAGRSGRSDQRICGKGKHQRGSS